MQLLLFRAGRDRLVGVALEHVVELMRPLPVSPIAGLPPFVSGISIIRGSPTPVVDLRVLLGDSSASPDRLILVRVGDRRVALAVDAVLGIHTVSAKALAQLPGLIGAVAAGFVESLGLLDTELFMLLRTGHLIPESAWSALGLEA